MHFKQKVLSLSVGKGRNGCQNSILRVQNINFPVKNLKYPQLFIILVLTAKNTLRKLFGRLVKSVLVCTTVTFWKKMFSWSFFFRGLFDLKVFRAVVQSVLVKSKNTFWGKLVILKLCFFSFWDFECKFYALWQNKLIEIVKTSFT